MIDGLDTPIQREDGRTTAKGLDVPAEGVADFERQMLDDGHLFEYRIFYFIFGDEVAGCDRVFLLRIQGLPLVGFGIKVLRRDSLPNRQVHGVAQITGRVYHTGMPFVRLHAPCGLVQDGIQVRAGHLEDGDIIVERQQGLQVAIGESAFIQVAS